VGGALALLGLVAFGLSGVLSSYRLEGVALDRLVETGLLKEAHAPVLADELELVVGTRHVWVGSFLGSVDAAIDRANRQLDSSATIWDYDRGRYRYQLARAASQGPVVEHTGLFLLLSLGLACIGALMLFLPRLRTELPGVRNIGVMHRSLTARGALGIAMGVLLTGFYIVLYFFPEHIVGMIRLGDPASQALRGRPSDQWFFYGLLYTAVVLVMGVRMLVHYRHSRYHVIRTLSVMLFQLGFAFLIPAILASLGKPEADLKNAWPLDYDLFFAWNLESLLAGGAFGWIVLVWGIALALVVVPLLAFMLGKRWYCSWVCGCGGLAETLGDPFRHLSSKRLRAWQIERWSVHLVLVLVVLMTAIVLINFLSGRDGSPLLGDLTWRVQSWYGFLIGSIFAGVVGTGFYPVLGSRVWCRFGCPLAAILGIVQRFRSRFRITTNGGQCISCGSCSTYCEMGIDVRWYAQRGQSIVRASCVGCGICSAVCPRGVLRLENGPVEGRLNTTSLVQIDRGLIDLDPPRP
jgi:Pyruvate/2-oxoacid:ferredoxin oxidoreductase delta subunit